MTNYLPAINQNHSNQTAGSYTFSPQPSSLEIDGRLFNDLTTPGSQALVPWTSNLETLFAESGNINGNLVLCQNLGTGKHSRTEGMVPSDINALVEFHQPEYFRTCLVSSDVPDGRQGGDSDVRAVLFFAIDLDANKDGHCSRSDALLAVKSLKHQPTLVVNTEGESGGFHLYWQFADAVVLSEEPGKQQTELADLQSRLDAIHADLRKALGEFPCSESNGRKLYLDQRQKVHRLLRVTGVRRRSGELVTIHSKSDCRYKPGDFEPKPEVKAPQSDYSPATHDVGEKPSEFFNKNVKVANILRDHGWEQVGENKWRRPGKTSGHSASITKAQDGTELLTVFSPNAYPFEAEKKYNAFAVWAKLEHGDDWSEAAKPVRELMSEHPKSDVMAKYREGVNKRVEALHNGLKALQGASQGVQIESGSQPCSQDKPLSRSEQVREENIGMFRDALHVPDSLPDDEASQKIEGILENIFLDLDELVKQTGGKRREIILDGLVRQGGICNVVAASKTGKSWLMYSLIETLVSGKGDWLGFKSSGRFKCLLLDSELDKEELTWRIQKVRTRIGSRWDGESLKNFKAATLSSFNFSIDRLERLLETQSEKPDIVILDALYFFLDGVDENSNKDMSEVYRELRRITANLGVTIFLVHHTSKGNQSLKEVADVGSGAGSIARAADAHLTIRPHAKSTDDATFLVVDSVVRTFEKSKTKTVEFTWPTFQVREDVEPELKSDMKKSSKVTTDELIFKCLDLIHEAKHDGIAAYELADKVERGEEWVKKKLRGWLEAEEPEIIQLKGRKQRARYYSTKIPRNELITHSNLKELDELDRAINIIRNSPRKVLTRKELVNRFADLKVSERSVDRIVARIKDDPRFIVEQVPIENGRMLLIGLSPQSEKQPDEQDDNPFR